MFREEYKHKPNLYGVFRFSFYGFLKFIFEPVHSLLTSMASRSMEFTDVLINFTHTASEASASVLYHYFIMLLSCLFLCWRRQLTVNPMVLKVM